MSESNLFVKNIPSIQEREFKYRGRMDSHKLNEMQKEAFDDILDLFNNFENERYSYTLKQKVLGSHNFDEEYIERLCRVKTLRSVKNEGGIDNKYVVLRIDIENYINISKN